MPAWLTNIGAFLAGMIAGNLWNMALILLNGKVLENVLWSYPDPVSDAIAIGDYVAFYPEVIDRWFEDEEEQHAEEVARQDHHANPLMSWLLREAPELPTATTGDAAEE